jgi:peptidyl-prolyl cis-trans isomerase D
VLNDLRKAAGEMNIPIKTSDFVGHDGQVPELGAMTGPASIALTLPKGAISGPLNLGDKGAVLSVLDRQEPSADEIAKSFAQTREQLLNAQREEIFRIYLGTLAEKYQKSGAIVMSKKPASTPGLPLGN